MPYFQRRSRRTRRPDNGEEIECGKKCFLPSGFPRRCSRHASCAPSWSNLWFSAELLLGPIRYPRSSILDPRCLFWLRLQPRWIFAVNTPLQPTRKSLFLDYHFASGTFLRNVSRKPAGKGSLFSSIARFALTHASEYLSCSYSENAHSRQLRA